MGLEPLQGLRESAVSLRLDRADDLLRARRGGGADLAHGPVEVPEDPMHFFFQSDEAVPPECLDEVPRGLLQRTRRDLVGGLQAGGEAGRREGGEGGLGEIRRNLPSRF